MRKRNVWKPEDLGSGNGKYICWPDSGVEGVQVFVRGENAADVCMVANSIESSKRAREAAPTSEKRAMRQPAGKNVSEGTYPAEDPEDTGV